MALFRTGLAIGAIAVFAARSRAEAPPAINSPIELWRGIDSAVEPLDIERLKSWEEGAARFEALRFTGEQTSAGPVRVYALRGIPSAEGRYPGILHIHGGGQTASLDWVKFWVERGYACVSFDFCGPWADRKDVTDWGPVRHANMAQAAGGFQLRPTPRESSWFHWALVSRRALTLLCDHPQVDDQRVGIFGISVGGSLTWMVAATDPRVKAAVPIYGCGYNYDRRNVVWGLPEPSDDLRTFQRVLGPEAHAPLVSCPVLFLNATNDFHGLFDRGFETLDATAGETWQAFTPRTNHHIHPQQGRNLVPWMDWHLKDGPPFPGNPRITIELDEAGVSIARVRPAQPDSVTHVEVYYALGERRPPARFWRTAVTVQDGQGWTAALPVVDAWSDLRAFANVSYQSGVCLSSRLRTVIPAQIGAARPTLEKSLRMEAGPTGFEHWYFTNGYTDPNRDLTYFVVEDDATTGRCLTANLATFGDPVDLRASTHIVGDPQFIGPERASLVLGIAGTFEEGSLSITAVVDDWGPRATRYRADIPSADAGPGWKEIVLPAGRFLDREGRALSGWTHVDKLEVEGRATRAGAPRIGKLEWRIPSVNEGTEP